MTITPNRYGAICAEIYDIDKPLTKPWPDIAFYCNRLKEIGEAILEPGVGSGRALVPMLQAGFDVTGFDASDEMLAQCKARCAEFGFSPTLKSARFEDFSYDQKFSAIVMPVRSFTLISDFDVAVSVLKRFHAHLKPGGLVMLDVGTVAELHPSPEGVRRWNAANGDYLSMEVRRVDTDYIAQVFTYHLRYERWRAGKLIDTELDVMAQRAWGVREFEMALREAGFGEITITPNYERGRRVRAADRNLTFEAISV